MSRKAKPSVIGAFVLGAIGLVTGGLVVFGGGGLFEDTTTYVMYFDETVSGLAKGAPVMFRGVKVGEVSDIRGTIDPGLDIDIPVLVRLGGARIQPRGGDPDAAPPRDEILPILVKRGMRAQLGIQSVVTGQLQIDLDFHPDNEAIFRGDGTYPEIPTVPSPLSEMLARLQQLPLQEIGSEMIRVLQGVDRFVSSPDLKAALRDFSAAMRSAQRLADHLDKRLDPLADSAEEALSIAAENSPTRYALDNALVELAAAARAIRVLAEYLEQHPESLLSGKSGQ